MLHIYLMNIVGSIQSGVDFMVVWGFGGNAWVFMFIRVVNEVLVIKANNIYKYFLPRLWNVLVKFVSKHMFTV